jgi:hypothetical protein
MTLRSRRQQDGSGGEYCFRGWAAKDTTARASVVLDSVT